jgi:hypothetical protein
MIHFLRKALYSKGTDETAQVEANASTIGAMQGAALVAMPGSAAANHSPAANTKATTTVGAPGAGRCLIVTSLSGLVATGATAITESAGLTLDLYDGNTKIMSWPIVCATNDKFGVAPPLPPGGIKLSSDSAAKLEFSAAGGANTHEAVNMTYVTANA